MKGKLRGIRREEELKGGEKGMVERRNERKKKEERGENSERGGMGEGEKNRREW